MLGYLIRKGNTTVYEWRTGSEPKKIERPAQVQYIFGDDEEKKANNGGEQEQEDKIDFGDFNIVTETNNQNEVNTNILISYTVLKKTK